LTTWTAEQPRPGVTVHQPRRGFRYGAEAFWLVGFALEGGMPAAAVDLGTGSGIMAWLLSAQGCKTWGVDIRREWQEGWVRSLRDSDEASPTLVSGDAHTWSPPQQVDLVVSNPPFFQPGSGPEPTDPWRAAARFEGQGTIAAFISSAAQMITNDGRICVVVPADRGDDTIAAGNASGLSPRRIVHVGRRRVVVELTRTPCAGSRDHISEQDSRAQEWYQRARAQPRPLE
jgi:tRNA1Val (adenine37-N6)-methyltransferase